MKIQNINLENTTNDKVKTEIIYNIVSARTDGLDLIVFTFSDKKSNNDCRKVLHNAQKTIKELYSRGQISYFALPENFEKRDTVCQYIYNKFPEFEEFIQKHMNERFILVKL